MDKYEESIRRATALKLGNKTFPAGNDHQQLHRHNQINLGQSSGSAGSGPKVRSASSIAAPIWPGNANNISQVRVPTVSG